MMLRGLAVALAAMTATTLAAALRRRSRRPARRFVGTTVALTALSLVPPLLVGADAATTAALLGLHVIAAVVLIPALARELAAGKTRRRAEVAEAAPAARA